MDSRTAQQHTTPSKSTFSMQKAVDQSFKRILQYALLFFRRIFECWSKCFCQIRLMFVQPYPDKIPAYCRLLCLIRLLCRSEQKKADDHWKSKCRELLRQDGCDLYGWHVCTRREYTHVVISVSDILRPVCFEPDVSGPVYAGENTPYSLKLLSEAVIADKKKYDREKAQYGKQIKRLARRGIQLFAVPEDQRPRTVRPALKTSDGFNPSSDKDGYRIFLNNFMPWTTTTLENY